MLLVPGCWSVVIPRRTERLAMQYNEPATSNILRSVSVRAKGNSWLN
jgi:hypothetical protein